MVVNAASSHITLQHKTGFPVKLSRVKHGRPPGKTRLLLEEVLVRHAGGAHRVVCVGPNAPVEWWGHYTVKKHCPSDETLNQGPDTLWSLKIPGCPLKKSRGVTPASWPNSPIDLWPSWPPNHPHTLIDFITLSPLHQWAGVYWAFWRTMAAVTSSRWMLHTGGEWGE